MLFSGLHQYIRHSRGVVLAALALSILQCKPEPPKSTGLPVRPTAKLTAPAECEPIQASDVNDAFGFVDTEPIDASKLRIENPQLLVLEDVQEQRSVIVKVDPIESSDENIYPDYALINVFDVENKPCIKQEESSRETPVSLIKEFMIGTECKGTLKIEAQACASTSRRLDPAIKCGEKKSTSFQFEASPPSEMGEVKDEIEDVQNRLSLLAKWLAVKATEFLKAVPELPSNAQPYQATLHDFAKVVIADQTAFSEIFATDAYELLLAELNETEQASVGIQLAAGTSDACRPVPSLAPATTESTQTEDSKVDTDAVLEKARKEHGADEKSQGDSLTSSVTPPKSQDPVDLGDEKTPEKIETENISLQRAGGLALLGVSALWAIRLTYKQVKRFKARRDFMQVQLEGAIGEDNIDAFKTQIKGDIQAKKISWVQTKVAKQKIFTYDGRLIKMTPAPAGGGGKVTFEMVDPNSASGLSLKRQYKIGPKRLEGTVGVGSPTKTGYVESGVKARTSADSGYRKTGSGRVSTGVQIGAILIMATMGGVMASGAMGLTEDPYAIFLGKIQKAESTLNELKASLRDLEKRRVSITVDSIEE